MCTRVHCAYAQQRPVRDGGEVVCSHGRDGLRIEVPVVQHAGRQLRCIAAVALVAVQPPVVLALPGALQPQDGSLKGCMILGGHARAGGRQNRTEEFLLCSISIARSGDLSTSRHDLAGKHLMCAVAGVQLGARTVLAERPPRNPVCLAAGGRGLRQAAHMPRCSFTRSASASRGGSSVSSLTRLPYLQRMNSIRPVLCCHWLLSSTHAGLHESRVRVAICSSLQLSSCGCASRTITHTAGHASSGSLGPSVSGGGS